MSPEQHWAEKAVEEIMQDNFGGGGLVEAAPALGYEHVRRQFKTRAVEIIKRHAIFAEESLTDSLKKLTPQELDAVQARINERLAERIASKLEPKHEVIHVEGELKPGPLNELMKKLAANVKRGEERLKPKDKPEEEEWRLEHFKFADISRDQAEYLAKQIEAIASYESDRDKLKSQIVQYVRGHCSDQGHRDYLAILRMLIKRATWRDKWLARKCSGYWLNQAKREVLVG
jgi:predicted nuclease with TOPRIM domain